MKVKEAYSNEFKPPAENYNGVLNHDGTIKVAKGNIKAKILNVNKKSVQVKGHKKHSYHCNIHKDLLKSMYLVEKGDTGFIKYRNGEFWLVGFQKTTAQNDTVKPTGDAPVKNTNWIYFFNNMEMEQ